MIHGQITSRHLDKKMLETRFPTIKKHLEQSNITLGEDLIPVSPVQHFNVGGIKVDLLGKTSMENLYANGECASNGVHGANRLASNSLLECVVFGKRIADDINTKEIVQVNYTATIKKYELRNYNYIQMKNKLGQLMDEYVGIVRTEKGLLFAKEQVIEMSNMLIAYPNNNKFFYEALNMVESALLIINGAIERKDSLGCHYRINQ